MESPSSGTEIAARTVAGLPLQNTDALFGALIENAFEIITIANTDGAICYANPSTERVLGYKPAELIGYMLLKFFHPDDVQSLIQVVDEINAGSNRDASFALEPRVRHKDGSWRILECIFKALDTPSIKGIVINARDITARKQEESIRAGQTHVIEMIATGAPLQDVLDNLIEMIDEQCKESRCAILLLDEDGTQIRHFAGLHLEQNAFDAVNNAAVHRAQPVIVSDIEHDALTLAYRDLAAHHGIFACYCGPIFSPLGNTLGTFNMYFSIARSPNPMELTLAKTAVRIAGIAIERKQAREKIYHMAYHDALTGLPNRVLLHERLTQAIIHAQRIKDGVAVLFIDLDQFKHINDTLGHEIGDRLLQMVTLRLKQCMRKDDSLARLGGDEFVLMLMAPADSHSAAQVAQKILDSLQLPIKIDEHELHVSCSIGISLFPVDGEDAEALMRNADSAMYHAKAQGRGNYQYFTSALNAAAQYRHSIANQLRQGLMQSEFSLHYQGQVDMQSGTIFAMEALLRWRQAERGMVAPADFLSIAEETGLILPIGEWVLRESCSQLKRWINAGCIDLRISVNLSVRQLLQNDIVDIVAKILDETALPPEALTLEITESILMPPIDDCLATMKKLSKLGVQLSLDDFGTGYSSLSHLQQFPLNAIKIDQSFVRGIGLDQNDMAITNAIIAMARTLDMTIIAEGVETSEQASFLQNSGCRSAQGFFYGKPVAADAMTVMLRKQISYRY